MNPFIVETLLRLCIVVFGAIILSASTRGVETTPNNPRPNVPLDEDTRPKLMSCSCPERPSIIPLEPDARDTMILLAVKVVPLIVAKPEADPPSDWRILTLERVTF